CPVRLRPILMTSMATIAAAIPQALGFGSGAETRAPLARSIIGGIVLSTLVTLIIVPVFYLLFDRFGNWVRGLTRREKAPDDVPVIAVAGVPLPPQIFLPPEVPAPGQESTRLVS